MMCFLGMLSTTFALFQGNSLERPCRFSGYVLCYGQTGGGAPYTFGGEGGLHRVAASKEKKRSDGLVPRMVEGLFDLAVHADPAVEITIRLSFLEVYMDSVFDLLSPGHTRICGLRQEEDSVLERCPLIFLCIRCFSCTLPYLLTPFL